MSSKQKNLIRVVVLVALFAWPGVETYRYYSAVRALAASEKLYETVKVRVAQARTRQTPAVMKASNKTNP